MTLKIAVIGGTGNVGSRLAERLSLAGQNVFLASRDPQDEKALNVVKTIKEKTNGFIEVADYVNATKSADSIIIATPGLNSPEEWEKIVHPFLNYEGTVIDATNPLTAWPELNISIDQNQTSAAEDIQKVLPKAKVFKAFNTIGAELMSKPEINGKPITMMFAGPNEEPAKSTVTKIISLVGFVPYYVGPQRAARNLESIAELWIHMAIKYGFPREGFAFDVHHDKSA